LQTDRIPFLPTSNQTTTQKQYISSLFFWLYSDERFNQRQSAYLDNLL